MQFPKVVYTSFDLKIQFNFEYYYINLFVISRVADYCINTQIKYIKILLKNSDCVLINSGGSC